MSPRVSVFFESSLAMSKDMMLGALRTVTNKTLLLRPQVLRRSGVFKQLIEELRMNDIIDGHVPYIRFSMRSQNLLCSRVIVAKRLTAKTMHIAVVENSHGYLSSFFGRWGGFEFRCSKSW